MENPVTKEWKKYKGELHENIEKTIERDNADKETLKLMLNMLEHSKFKINKDRSSIDHRST